MVRIFLIPVFRVYSVDGKYIIKINMKINSYFTAWRTFSSGLNISAHLIFKTTF